MRSRTSPQFILDSNVLITAKNSYYAFDICPLFWKAIVDASEDGHIVSIDRVRDELLAGRDGLSQWAKTDATGMFVPSSESAVLRAYADIVKWVQPNQQFTDGAKAEFARVADGWIAAYATAHSITVVTLETFDPNVKRRVKLPNVCRQFNVDYIDTFDMLRRLGVSL